MGLYTNYGPIDDSNLTLRQMDRIEHHQEMIQAQIEDEIKHDHFRFYGYLANHREIDEDSITEMLTNMDPDTELPHATDLCDDLVQLPALQRLGLHTGQSLVRFIAAGDQVPYDRWDQTLDYVDQSFDIQGLTLSDYPFLEHVYDLKNQDDFEELAEQYYAGNERDYEW